MRQGARRAQLRGIVSKKAERPRSKLQGLSSRPHACRNPRLERVQRGALFRRVVDRCKRVRMCPACGASNGVVRCGGSALPPPGLRSREGAPAMQDVQGGAVEGIRGVCCIC